MNKHFIADYLGYVLLKTLGPVLRVLPKKAVFASARVLGDIFYLIDAKHRAIAYSNIRVALADKLNQKTLAGIIRATYRGFFQCLMEVFLIPLMDKNYFDKYVFIEGREHIGEGFKKGKGIIFVGMHEGSWELSNIISANLDVPFHMFVQEQKFPRMNRLLNSYRMQKGCRLIKRENQIKQLIGILNDNQSVGMTIDQGGKSGIQVKFFGKNASMPTGAVRLALKYDAAIIPVYTTRIHGPYLKVVINPPLKLKRSGDQESDVRDNLQRLVKIYEDLIRIYPRDYLWTYKIWKYSDERDVLILSDAKTGHLRQSQALAGILRETLKEKNISVNSRVLEIGYKDGLSRLALAAGSCLSDKYSCQGCLWCLRKFLKEDVFGMVSKIKPDIIISCGSSLARVNSILASENQAKSLVIMRPALMSNKMFDLLIVPKHDNPRPARNIVVTEGALNLMDEEYLNQQSQGLLRYLKPEAGSPGSKAEGKESTIGLLIGGDTKDFSLDKDLLLAALKELKSVSSRLNVNILATTSRRTSGKVEKAVKDELAGFPSTKLLIIANENNIPEAVGGILALSQVVLVSAESISMISEAVSSNRYVVVLDSKVDPRHRKFLNYMADKGYIYLCGSAGLSSLIIRLLRDKPGINPLKDRQIVKNALRRVI